MALEKSDLLKQIDQGAGLAQNSVIQPRFFLHTPEALISISLQRQKSGGLEKRFQNHHPKLFRTPMKIASSLIERLSIVILTLLLVFSPVKALPQNSPPSAAVIADDATIESLKFEYEVAKGELWKPFRELQDKYEENLKMLLLTVTNAGDLKKVVAVKAVLEGFREGETALADEAMHPELNRLQKIYAEASEQITARIGANSVPVVAAYRAKLEALQTRLTRQSKIDEALKVSEVIEKLPALTTPLAAAALPPEPGKRVGSLASATKEKPFENSLGMKFVPVPIKGGRNHGKVVLFSIWETRVKDYEAFIRRDRDRPWPEVNFEQESDHPAVNISWQDAVAFSEWLTEEDRKSGKLGERESYRLPSDHEWSCAVGIGHDEIADVIPSTKNGKIPDVYPWGVGFPPPKGAGNYFGEETKRNPAAGAVPIPGYDDGFDRTSPVGSFEANEFGLFDLGGNVWEWCQDSYSGNEGSRVLRGGAWNLNPRDRMLSSSRNGSAPENRFNYNGFRLVVDSGG